MSLSYPPLHPDDTQPAPTITTQPRAYLLPGWVLTVLLVVTSVSLMGTLSLLLSGTSASVSNENAAAILPHMKTITLHQNNQQIDIETTAATVADFLAEQQLVIAPDDALSDTLETRITDGMTLYIARAREVALTIDGQREIIRTPLENPHDIVQRANITLQDADRVWLDGVETSPGDLLFWQLPVSEIVIDRAITLTVIDGTETSTYETTAATVGDALVDADFTLSLADVIAPESGTPLVNDTTVIITRAEDVMLSVDGATSTVQVQPGTTVLDALALSGTMLAGMDYSIPPEDETVTPGMTIQVVRVTETIESTEETIAFETIYQADAALELDTRQTVQNGQNGIRQIDERVFLADGIEVGRESAGEHITREPQNHIIAYGTNIIIRSRATEDGTIEYWRKLRVYATSYHPEALGGDSTTALGMQLQKGMIAADPRLIPYRTNLYVPGYGQGIMGDTGGPRQSRYWIDLGYSDEDFVNWYRYTDVYLLTPVPADVTYLLPAWSSPHPNIPDN